MTCGVLFSDLLGWIGFSREGDWFIAWLEKMGGKHYQTYGKWFLWVWCGPYGENTIGILMRETQEDYYLVLFTFASQLYFYVLGPISLLGY